MNLSEELELMNIPEDKKKEIIRDQEGFLRCLEAIVAGPGKMTFTNDILGIRVEVLTYQVGRTGESLN